MNRRIAVSLLVAVFVAHATGFTLAAHHHECHGDHDARQCSACQMLLSGASLLPAQMVPPALDVPVDEAAALPADPDVPTCDDDAPRAPRAPPLA